MLNALNDQVELNALNNQVDQFTYNDIFFAFKKCKLKKNDSVFLTTNIALLGIPKTKDANHLKIKSNWILKAIKKIIGNNGNIFVPTYSYTFQSKNKNTFDVNKTKSEIGYFPNFFLKQKNIIRNIDPMISIAGYGPKVKNILLNCSHTSYGKNCVFERLLEIKNLKCITLGLGINWIPFIHYLDWLNQVPFRYDKYFEGYIKQKGIKKYPIRWHYPVRYLKNKTFISDGYKLGKLAYKNRMFKETDIGRGKIHSIEYLNYFNFCKKKSKHNKWITANA